MSHSPPQPNRPTPAESPQPQVTIALLNRARGGDAAAILRNAPSTEAGFFIVPRVVE